MAEEKHILYFKFTIKDLVFLKYFLGLEVAKSSTAIMHSQTKFIFDILKDVGIMFCKSAFFSLPKDLHLSPDTGDVIFEPYAYRRLTGILLYVNLTKPDISYDVQHLVSL